MSAAAPPRLARLGLLGGGLGVLLCGLTFVARPWYRSWGATVEERLVRQPGDEIVPAGRTWTNAVTIAAPADRVWPWVAQLGQDRAGFYSFGILEDLVGCHMPRGDRLLPDRQAWRPGDRLWMYPRERAPAMASAPLALLEPGHALGFAMHESGGRPDASWTFIVEPAGAIASRLIVRDRGLDVGTIGANLFGRLVFEPAHFAMQRRMMLGIQERVEGRMRSLWWEDGYVLAWTWAFVLFVLAGVATVRRASWRRAYAVYLAAGVGFAVLTLVQPPLFVALLLCLLLTGALYGPPRRLSSAA